MITNLNYQDMKKVSSTTDPNVPLRNRQVRDQYSDLGGKKDTYI